MKTSCACKTNSPEPKTASRSSASATTTPCRTTTPTSSTSPTTFLPDGPALNPTTHISRLPKDRGPFPKSTSRLPKRPRNPRPRINQSRRGRCPHLPHHCDLPGTYQG